MKRRDFFKISAIASGTVISACNNRVDEKILPYLIPPDEGVVPGVPHYINSTCSGCSAGCGIKVKVLDTKAVKVEGNPAHPVNMGGLCIRGQASIASAYLPCRIKYPVLANSQKTEKTDLAKVFDLIKEGIKKGEEKGKKNILIDNLNGDTIKELSEEFCSKKGFARFGGLKKIDYSALTNSYGKLFGYYSIPDFRIDKADFLLTVGADILDTFINPARYSKLVAKARKNNFKWIHLSEIPTLTGYAADENYYLNHNGELSLLNFIRISAGLKKPGNKDPFPSPDTLRETSLKTGLDPDTILKIIKGLNRAKNPLLMTGGPYIFNENSSSNASITAIIQKKLGMPGKTVIFYDKMDKRREKESDFSKLSRIKEGSIGTAIIFGDNLNTLPHSVLKKALSADLSILISDTMPGNIEEFDIVLPMSGPFETWNDSVYDDGTISITRPSVKSPDGVISAGDILLNLLGDKRSWQKYLTDKWNIKGYKIKEMIKKGFLKGNSKKAVIIGTIPGEGTNTGNYSEKNRNTDFVYFKPDIRKLDGRGNDIELLNEIPDPLTTVSYGEYVEISEKEAKKKKLKEGDEVTISGEFGSITLPVLVSQNLAEGTKVIPLSSASNIDFPVFRETGISKLSFNSPTIKKTGRYIKFPRLSGSFSTSGRDVFPREKSEEDHHEVHKLHTLYPEHEHKKYRWAMVIDLDACTGCSSCVASCYIENNVPMTGKDEHLKGREMSWLRIEPYFKQDGKGEFLPMMCQQCDHAPCETVCPVYATYHNEEGLNAQVYNRCVGTRYCANNCPYKARRFNWFDNSGKLPLNAVFNSEISVRPKGVMEKCTFCIQRIRAAKDSAKDEKRDVRDGEVIPACAQSCPSDAIVFGNLLDPESNVSKLLKSRNIFRVHESLGTRPAVYYIKGKKSKVITHFEKKLEEG